MKRTVLRGLLFPVAVVLAALMCGSAAAATITVNTVSDSSADDGSCTLREAITSANGDAPSGVAAGECAAGAGADSIVFAIPGSGQHLITPGTVLPNLSTPMSIDGSTDPPQIGLDGSLTGGNIGLYVNGNNVSINGLSIIRWGYGIWIAGADSTTVTDSRIGTNLAGASGLGSSVVGVQIGSGATGTVLSDSVISSSAQEGVRINDETTTGVTLTGNLIGTDPSGTVALPNSDGISVTETDGTRIGGPDPGDGNVISGNSGRGVVINASTTPGRPAEDALVQGNFIGTDITGSIDLGNAGAGLYLLGDVRRTFVEDNVVSGNGSVGILLEDWSPFNAVGPSDTLIRGNRIGVGADGGPMANATQGISVDALSDLPLVGTEIGGTVGLTPGGACTGDCNVIAGNTVSGVFVRGQETKVSILGNEIRSNGSLGIELTPFTGFTVNDPGDTDTGANELQNFPVFDAALADTIGARTLVTGRLNSSPDATFRIEVFENGAADPSRYGEGEKLLGGFEVSTDGGGDAVFGEFFPAQDAAASPLSATATRTDVTEPFTSEFSLVEGEDCDQSDGAATGLLVAGGGGDSLCGLAGEDVLRGSTGGDIFDGGEGSDTADLSLSAAPVTGGLASGRVTSDDGIDLMLSIENLTGSPQSDQLDGDGAANVIDGGEGADSIDAGAGADTVIGGEGDDVIDVADGVADTLVDCGPGNDIVNADSIDVDAASIYTGCETINRPPSALKCNGNVATIVGTNLTETVIGTTGRDIIVARAGADTILAQGGNDVICAGDGNDIVKGGDGNDLVYGQNGADELVGEGGADDLFGGEGNDDLFGGDGADLVDGGNGADLVDGRDGVDTLKGRAGTDTLKGGNGNDTMLGGDSADTLLGGNEKDTLKGENGNDTLKGEGGTDRLFGGDANDTLFAGSGNVDLIYGQAGFDKLNGGTGKGDFCSGGSGNDRRSAPGCERRSSIP